MNEDYNIDQRISLLHKIQPGNGKQTIFLPGKKMA